MRFTVGADYQRRDDQGDYSSGHSNEFPVSHTKSERRRINNESARSVAVLAQLGRFKEAHYLLAALGARSFQNQISLLCDSGEVHDFDRTSALRTERVLQDLWLNVLRNERPEDRCFGGEL